MLIKFTEIDKVLKKEEVFLSNECQSWQVTTDWLFRKSQSNERHKDGATELEDPHL